MKNKIILLLTGLMLFSCNPDEFLDVLPTDAVIPETVDHFDQLLNNPSNSTATTWYNMAYMDPDVYLPGRAYQDLWLTQWKRQYEWDDEPFTLTQTDGDYVIAYRRIHNWNLIIGNIDGAALDGKTEADRKRIKGEAYGQRAFDYFLTVNEYGPHYSQENLDKPAIPMPLNTNLETQYARSTVGEVYAQIESDLATAEELLADHVDYEQRNNFRPSRSSIAALHAMIALYKGDFATAVSYSNKSLEYHDFIYDYKDFSNRTPGDAWSQLNTNIFYFSTDLESVIWNRYHRYNYYDPAQYIHPDLVALFDKENDQRFILFSSNENYFGVDVSPNVCYARVNAETQAGINVPQVMLVNAEAKARTGDLSGALEQINRLLENRIFDFEPYSTSDFANAAEVLQLVKNERRKEFMCTGYNLIDQKRYHTYGDNVPTFTREIEGQTYTLEPGSDKYIVPISLKVKDLNPNLN